MKISFTQRTILSLVVLTSLWQAKGFAQCYTNEIMREYIKQDPGILEREALLEEITQSKEITVKPGTESILTGTVYVIPVVFHVLHMYGTENIEDIEIIDQIAVLNRDFRNQRSDTTSIVSQFKPLIADCEIEFRLATKDPNGNCTNGIDRIYTHKTLGANDNSKLNQWDPHKYLNIWVIKTWGPGFPSNLAAYSTFPSMADGINLKKDGIMIKSVFLSTYVLTHEVGHYLNLHHTWGDLSGNGQACGGDDFVADTPPTIGSSLNCNLNLSVCDTPHIENVQNYMDYSSCSARMFTEGQKNRMRAALESSVAHRNNLWQQSNLVATGTDVPTTTVCSPDADFYSNKFFICQGAGLGLFGQSNKGTATSWSWSMPNATPSAGATKNMGVQYLAPATGWQTVSLTVTNASGSDMETKSTSVYVSPPNADFQANYYDNLDAQGHFNNYWFPVNTGRNASQFGITQTASYTGAACIMLNSYSPAVIDYFHNPPIVNDPGIGANDVDYLISPAFDMNWVTNMTMSFRLAYASRATISQDITETLKIYYSLNCGETWSTPIYSKAGGQLLTAGHRSGAFVPSSQSDWRLETIALPSNLNNRPNVRFKIEYVSGDLSNNLYIDDFSIAGTVGFEDDPSNPISMNIFPNPGSGNTTLTYNLKEYQNIAIEVTDILGQVVYGQHAEYQSAGAKSLVLPTESLNAGVYFIRVLSDTKLVASEKLVMTH